MNLTSHNKINAKAFYQCHRKKALASQAFSFHLTHLKHLLNHADWHVGAGKPFLKEHAFTQLCKISANEALA